MSRFARKKSATGAARDFVYLCVQSGQENVTAPHTAHLEVRMALMQLHNDIPRDLLLRLTRGYWLASALSTH
jgi:hypothetical protein